MSLPLRPRSYKPKAYAELPHNWAEPLIEEYLKGGFTVEWDILESDRSKAWVRIHGLTQRELNQQLNDPLGKPGEQETRHPLSSRHKRKTKPMREEDYLLAVEEARYPMWDDDDP